MHIGFVTIGQAPRDDIIGPFRARLGPVEIEQGGALDGLTDAEIAALAPEPGEEPLLTRLQSGRQVTIGKRSILGLMQQRIDELVRQSVNAIVVLCTGPFPELAAPLPLVLPDQVLRHFVLGVLPTGRLGVIAPIPEQVPLMREKWATYADLVIDAATPYGNDVTPVRRAATAMSDCALVVLDCMGFGPAAKAAAAAGSGRLVLVAQEVVAHTVELLAGIVTAAPDGVTAPS